MAPLVPPGKPNMHPLDTYRNYYRARILRLSPRSVLDVGCGDGALLAELRDEGCERVIGIDPNTAAVKLARQRLASETNICVGHAEDLPFADRSFDVVSLQYTAHHLRDLSRALAEAARVARIAVLVLDGWYDLSFASQRVAHDYDLWSKAIDEQQGMVHRPLANSAALTQPFLDADPMGSFTVELNCHLILQHYPVDDLKAHAELKLPEAADPSLARQALTDILIRAAKHGVSEDGAILLCAVRSEGSWGA
jgi:SAM-dependent methyltransferase